MKICLTFDAEFPDQPHGNGGDNTPQLLTILREFDVPAVFFVQGKWARVYPGTLQRIVDEGHQIGSHSYAHAAASDMTRDGFANDLQYSASLITDLCGQTPRPWYRYPYGRPAHLDVLKTLGYNSIGWNVDPEDYNPKNASADRVGYNLAQVIAPVEKAGVAAVVLFHTWTPGTRYMLREWVKNSLAVGDEFGVMQHTAAPAVV